MLVSTKFYSTDSFPTIEHDPQIRRQAAGYNFAEKTMAIF